MIVRMAKYHGGSLFIDVDVSALKVCLTEKITLRVDGYFN